MSESDREQREIEWQLARRPSCTHKWSWSKPGIFDKRWRRQCARCGKTETRSTPPGKERPATAQPTVRVARTKGDLVIRHVSGGTQRVPAAEATRAAREAVAAAEERERERESAPGAGDVRKTYTRKKPGPPFRKTAGEAPIDRASRTVENGARNPKGNSRKRAR
ncbi:MAG: hypothetical protein QOG43_1220 [Actinomycetota bacterium]|jgi:hypothetical protein|nr:hypothetical protein [Actinomycetota bacterium]